MQFQIWKKWAAAFLALALTAGALAGCSGGGESSAVSSATGSSAASSEVSSAASASSETSSTASESKTADYGKGLTEDGYFENITGLDYVKLPDYKTMEIPEDVSTVSDEDLQAELDSRMQEFATTEQVKDRAVEDGDTVNIDYVGSVDGVEFEGGNTGGNGTTVTIGVTSYIDDFLEQLIGHKPGETFDVNVTFPDPYENNTDLSGKDAVFVTTINYIEEENLPELTDAFVAENWKESEGWSTVEEAKEGAREELRTTAVANYLWQEIQDQAEVSEVPDALFDYQVSTMTSYYAALAKQYGMELADFLSQSLQVEDMDELVEKNKEQLDTNAKASLIMQALCEDMGVKITDEDIKTYFQTNLGVEDYSEYEKEYGRPYLCLLAREDLAKRSLGERK